MENDYEHPWIEDTVTEKKKPAARSVGVRVGGSVLFFSTEY
jgi:hypothetical protein